MDSALGLVLRGVVWLVSLLPLKLVRQGSRWLSALHLILDTRAAQNTRANLAMCFPELAPTALRALARDSLGETACIVGESGMVFHWPRERWLVLAEEPQVEPLQQALAADTGVLVMVPHYGNWEYLALFLGQYGAMALYERPRIASLEAPLRRARQRGGMTLLPIDREGLRSAYRQLAEGGCLALLPDQVPRRTAGVYAPFFGVPALTMTLAHRLIQRTRPIVLLGVARRTAAGFAVRFVTVGQPGDRERHEGIYAPAAQTSAAALNGAIEAAVKEDPAQYQWEYRRFRRQPKGSPDPYDPSRLATPEGGG